MQIYIISDTHFNHAKMIEYENRPANFNELIIKNWNKIVKPEDLVIHLGDAIVGLNSQLAGIMARLTGTKILCLGNHDKEKPNWYLSRGFAFVCDWFVLEDVAYSHYPLTPLPEGIRLNVHGHLHRNKVRMEPGNRYFNAGYYLKREEKYRNIHIEDTFSPFSLKDILDK